MIRSLFARFINDRSGVAFIIFAIMAGVLIPLAGGALDYSRALTAREHLAAAADAAALASSSIGQTAGSDSDKEVLARRKAHAERITSAFLVANYPEAKRSIAEIISDVKPLSNGGFSINLTARVQTNFLSLIGIRELPVSVVAETSGNPRDLEVVMVLDNSISMGPRYREQISTTPIESKLDALKKAAKSLTKILTDGRPESASTKFGLVPFSAAVNVGPNTVEAWLDRDRDSDQHLDDVALPTTAREGWTLSSEQSGYTLFDLYDTLNDTTWNGCVRARPGLGPDLIPLTADDDDVTDAPPVLDTASEKWTHVWVPMFAPDQRGPTKQDLYYPGLYFDFELSRYVSFNDYLPDDFQLDGKESSDKNLIEKLRSVDRYIGGTPWKKAAGPNVGCRKLLPIQRLTETTQSINDAIDAMTPSGRTAIPQGLVWGWRVISNSEPFNQGVISAPNVKKAIILMTDGRNDVGKDPNEEKSQATIFSAYGSKQPKNVDLDTKLKHVCANIKASNDEIQVFTISFGDNVPQKTKTMLAECASQDCANKACNFHAPSNDELVATFSDIANQLRGLRLVR